MKFDLNKKDIKEILKLIEEAKPSSYLKHIKNLLLNQRGSKQYTKKQLVYMVMELYPDAYLEKVQELSDKELYTLILDLENAIDNGLRLDNISVLSIYISLPPLPKETKKITETISKIMKGIL